MLKKPFNFVRWVSVRPGNLFIKTVWYITALFQHAVSVKASECHCRRQKVLRSSIIVCWKWNNNGPHINILRAFYQIPIKWRLRLFCSRTRDEILFVISTQWFGTISSIRYHSLNVCWIHVTQFPMKYRFSSISWYKRTDYGIFVGFFTYVLKIFSFSVYWLGKYSANNPSSLCFLIIPNTASLWKRLCNALLLLAKVIVTLRSSILLHGGIFCSIFDISYAIHTDLFCLKQPGWPLDTGLLQRIYLRIVPSLVVLSLSRLAKRRTVYIVIWCSSVKIICLLLMKRLFDCYMERTFIP